MRFIKVPSGDYYLLNKNHGDTSFLVKNSHTQHSKQGLIMSGGTLIVSKELIGKKVRVKLELVQ